MVPGSPERRIDWAPDGRLDVENQPDARLAQPLSGLYWQIDRLGAQPRWRWRARARCGIRLCACPPPQRLSGAGLQPAADADARGHDCWSCASVQLPDDDAPPLRLVVAADEALIAEPMAALPACCSSLARWRWRWPVGRRGAATATGAAPVKALRGAWRPCAGQAARLEGDLPQELKPWSPSSTMRWRRTPTWCSAPAPRPATWRMPCNTRRWTILANADGRDTPLARLVQEQVA